MALAITQESKKAWEKAINKAKATKPHVKILDYGKFKVCGSKGDCYTVTWTGHKGQELKASCDCPAGKKDRACYHIPPTANLFKQQVVERAEKARLANLNAEFCGECGGLRGGPDADEDHNTCTCTQHQGDHVCRNCGGPGWYVPAIEQKLCSTCYYLSQVNPELVKPCRLCNVPGKLDSTGVCPDCINSELFG